MWESARGLRIFKPVRLMAGLPPLTPTLVRLASARFDVDDERYWDGWANRTLVYEIAEAEADPASRAEADPAQFLAARRAALTRYYQAAESCDDSCGAPRAVFGTRRSSRARHDG